MRISLLEPIGVTPELIEETVRADPQGRPQIYLLPGKDHRSR